MIESLRVKNTVTNQEIDMDKLTSVYILDSVDWGTIESSHHSYKYVNQIGVYVTNTTLETRDVKIVGWVVGDTELELKKKKQLLNKMINPQQPMDINVDEYTLTMLPNSSIKYSVNYAENNEVMCKFQIDGYCPDPLFKTESEAKTVAASTLPKFKFPLIIPQPKGIIMGLRQPSLIVAIENQGAVSVGMKIVFVASGTVQNPQIINVNTQEFFKINKTMVAGESITINTNIGEKKIIGSLGGVDTNYFKYRDLDSTWLQLATGDNLIRYDASANLDALQVGIYHNDKYLEVQ